MKRIYDQIIPVAERLRLLANYVRDMDDGSGDARLYDEAADRIEVLEAALREIYEIDTTECFMIARCALEGK